MVDFAKADEATRFRLIQSLLDRQEIADVIHRYCRGVDRGDFDLVRSCYWPDAEEDHNGYQGPVEGFIGYASARVEGHDGTHTVTNISIDLEDDAHARVETYIRSFEFQKGGSLGTRPRDDPEAEHQDMEVAGRYLDLFEKRDGEWRILRRTLVIDWHTLRASGSIWDAAMFRSTRRRGGKFPDDPVYTVLPSLGKPAAE